MPDYVEEPPNDLSSKQIDDEGAKQIAKALIHSETKV